MRMKSNEEKRIYRRLMRHGLSCILSFLLSLDLFVLFFVLSLQYGVFQTQTLYKAIDNSNYYNQLHETITKQANKVLTVSGIPESVLENVFTLDQISSDARESIDNGLAGTEQTLDLTEMRQTFRDNILSYAKENHISKVDEDSVNDLIDNILVEYEKVVSFPMASYFTKYQDIYQKYYQILLPLTLIVALIIGIVLIRMQHWKHRALRYLAYAISGATILLSLVPIYGYATRFYDKIQLSPSYLRDVIAQFIQCSLNTFLGVIFGGILLYVITIVTISIMKRRLK